MVKETRPKRVLLLDDDLDFLTVTKVALEVVGDFVTLGCPTVQEALNSVEEFKPDLILVDVMMPGLDGVDFVQLLKSLPNFAQIPLMFMTAKANAENLESDSDAGAIAVISKPFDPEQLVLQMNAHWNAGTQP